MFTRIVSRKFSIAARPVRESTFKRVWVNVPAAWPIFAITAAAVAFSGYKVVQTLSGPDYHFNKQERSTIDYIENDRDPKQAEEWGNGTLRKGPQFIREKMIKKD